jgi:hypothetical protein
MFWNLFWLCALIVGFVWALRWAWRTEHTLKSAARKMAQEAERFLNRGQQ